MRGCNGRPLRTSFRVLGTGYAESSATDHQSAIRLRARSIIGLHSPSTSQNESQATSGITGTSHAMKRDLDLVRKLLVFFEAKPDDQAEECPTIDGVGSTTRFMASARYFGLSTAFCASSLIHAGSGRTGTVLEAVGR
jgi:hypothetical protein